MSLYCLKMFACFSYVYFYSAVFHIGLLQQLISTSLQSLHAFHYLRKEIPRLLMCGLLLPRTCLTLTHRIPFPQMTRNVGALHDFFVIVKMQKQEIFLCTENDGINFTPNLRNVTDSVILFIMKRKSPLMGLVGYNVGHPNRPATLVLN